MNEGFCSKCSFVLDIQNGAFATCDSCHAIKFCPQCVISAADGIIICETCQKSQEERVTKLQKISQCMICERNRQRGYIYTCSHCKQHYYCQNCYEKHACFRCSVHGCPNRYGYFCCDKRWCNACRVDHRRLECKELVYITCTRCKGKMVAFGPKSKKCPVLTCTSLAGCSNCDMIRSPKGVYCRWHTSTKNCEGLCKRRYALDTALGFGYLKVLILLGGTVHTKDCCGACLQRMRALIESVLIIIKRERIVFPKVLIDKIILFALDGGGWI